MSLRLKLTMLYTGVLCLALALFALAIIFTAGRILYRDVDAGISSTAASVVRSVAVRQSPFSLQEITLPNINVFATPDTYLQVVDSRGLTISRSDNLGRQYLPLSEDTLQAAGQNKAFYETVRAGTQSIRVYNVPLSVDGRLIGILQVGRTLATVDLLLDKIRLIVFTGGAATVFIAGLLGWFLARAALHPVERISRTALSIREGGDLSKRIDYSGPQDELGRMVNTLNNMFGRLEVMYNRLQESYDLQRRFVSDASHELRTPLTTIRGNTEFLLQLPNLETETAREAMEDIAGEARRLTRLLDHMLALARADAGFEMEKHLVPVDELWPEIARQARFWAGGRVLDLSCQLPAGKQVATNADYLSQLVFILLDNALKYSLPDTGVELAMEENPPGWLALTVADRGPGIAPGDESLIFNRFYRGEEARPREGSGLGLAIARWIAEQHQGNIQAANRPGGGSIFTVRLPLAKS
ncbi:MAG: ATP-binding protein [Firmicutes bacterium]|nr:ATP-binding protein [Bacillota bacterium]